MPELDITGLPLASAVADGDLLIKWDSTQVSGQRTQKFTAAQFRDYIVQIIPYGPAGPVGPKGDTGAQGLPGKDGNGAGTVTSVALTTPSDLSVSGSPITSAGTLAISRNPQAANVVMAGPASGANAVPTYRALVAADIPALPYTTTAQAAAAAPVQSVAGRTGAVTLAVADVSGAARSGANTDITSLASPSLGAATATTQSANDNSTKVATTAQVQAAIGANAGGGAPIAANQQSAAYTAVAADKGKTLILAGSSPLTLGPSTAVSGWYVWVRKFDGLGVWMITPSSGTIDGLSTISLYQESYLIWYDAASAVYRTQGRPKGWIPISTSTVSSAVASVLLTTGFQDPELREVEIDCNNVQFSASGWLQAQVQKSGAIQSTGYAISSIYNTSGGGTPTGVGAAGTSSFFIFNSPTIQTGWNFRIRIGNPTSTNALSQRVEFNGGNETAGGGGGSGEGYQTTAAAITGMSFSSGQGGGSQTINTGNFTLRGYRQ